MHSLVRPAIHRWYPSGSGELAAELAVARTTSVEIANHPDVFEVAAVPVPNEESEDDILVVVVPRPNRTIDPRELVKFCGKMMPHYMVPRYVRFMDALPKTPTQKVRKAILREAGVSVDTWDREAVGIHFKRVRLS